MRMVGAFLFWLAGPLIAGAIGSIASVRAPAFYAELVKPSWAPPPGLFGPVWTTLYLMMGLAAFLVWRRHGWSEAGPALLLFLVHLFFNGLWSWLFFHWRLGAISFAGIVLLWLMIATLTAWFWRLRPLAGALLLPYLGWVTFASALNFTLWQRNPGLLS